MRDLGLRRRCPRLLMAFSLTGPQRQGLVTLDVKKRKVGGGIRGGGLHAHGLQPDVGDQRKWAPDSSPRGSTQPVALLPPRAMLSTFYQCCPSPLPSPAGAL